MTTARLDRWLVTALTATHWKLESSDTILHMRFSDGRVDIVVEDDDGEDRVTIGDPDGTIDDWFRERGSDLTVAKIRLALADQ